MKVTNTVTIWNAFRNKQFKEKKQQQRYLYIKLIHKKNNEERNTTN